MIMDDLSTGKNSPCLVLAEQASRLKSLDSIEAFPSRRGASTILLLLGFERLQYSLGGPDLHI